MIALDQAQRIPVAPNVSPAAMNLERLFPMFTPARFFHSGRWPGPFELPAARGIGLTWAIDVGSGGIRYLDLPLQRYWEGIGTDWKAAAMRNLKRESKQLYTHALGRKGTVFAVAMIHPDGWGASRLLLRDELRGIFPDGYRAIIPEMSCGLAVSERIGKEEQKSIDQLIDKCFRHGTRPLSPETFASAEVLPPWIVSRA